MISVKELHAGDGYAYLLRGVADGQGMTKAVSPMTRYYTEAGHPPGQWMGTGLTGLAQGQGLEAGTKVSEQQMERLFKHAADPVTGDTLGRAFRIPKTWQVRAAARTAALPPSLAPSERAERIREIEDQERNRRVRQPVAGFDCVFSPPKSVSTLWALGDQGLREQITQAHYDAIAEVLRIMERDVARTRVGTDGVAQVDTHGLIAAAFDHYDSRAGDPQLHTHVVVANRVQGPDGKWRTLDSRGSLFPSVVAMSELYDTLLADRITTRIGAGWEPRGTPRKAKNQAWEITGVTDDLINEFSQRAAGIETAKDQLIDGWRATHGREPDDATILRLRQQATYMTRPDKHLHSLAELTRQWRARATTLLKTDPTQWASSLTHWNTSRQPPPAWRADDLAPVMDTLAAAALAELAEERSVWRTWNIRAAAARASMPYRLATERDRDVVIEEITARVAAASVRITPPQLASTPGAFMRGDGTSALTRTHGDIYTSHAILAAEDRLVAAANAYNAPVVDDSLVDEIVVTPTAAGHVLSDDQAAAVAQITASGRRVDVLVGPAGAGKTTALAALMAAWESAHGDDIVIGLAPSAAASDVLAESLGIATENTAKWLHESAGPAAERRRELAADLRSRITAANATGEATGHLVAQLERLEAEQRRWSFQPGQLVIVDEASLAGTLALDALREQVEQAGAKLLLVGDWAQLSAVDAGGAFGMLVRDRGDLAPELTDVRRFVHNWERAASIRLRLGEVDVIGTYIDHDRVIDGDTDHVIDTAYRAWRDDEHAGHRSLLIAADARMVRELNERARADRVTTGEVEPDGTSLHDGTTAGQGDRIVTRRNDRHLATGPSSWVKNGDHWSVTRRHKDGSLTVTRPSGGPAITLPAGYVAEHVDLAYAATAHRAQGSTVDTAHAIVTQTATTRETLYVAMTRGRASNNAYVVTDTDDEIPDGETYDARHVLTQVLRRRGAELSATETITVEQEQATSITRLAAEYDTIAREAAADRWAGILNTCLLPETGDDPTTSPSYAALVSAMRQADSHGMPPETVLPQLAAAREFDTSDDPIAVLHHRLEQATDHAHDRASGRPCELIAGLIPAARNVSDPAMKRALDERAQLIERRAKVLADRAITSRARWIDELGPRPQDDDQPGQWQTCVATVAAYRDRHDINAADALGPSHALNWTHRADRRRARLAIQRARQLSGTLDVTLQGVRPNRTQERLVDM